nr:hypothetical protein Iba_chr11aCG13660 [Ipomoea batatas]
MYIYNSAHFQIRQIFLWWYNLWDTYLKHNSNKCPELENLTRNSNTKLQENSRYKKGNQNCNPLHEAISQAWEIKMTNHPFITYHIPHSPVLVTAAVSEQSNTIMDQNL